MRRQGDRQDPWRRLVQRNNPSIGTRQAREDSRRYLDQWARTLPFDEATSQFVAATAFRASNSLRDSKRYANVLRLLALFRLSRGEPVNVKEFVSARSLKDFADGAAHVLGRTAGSMRNYMPTLKSVQRGLCTRCSKDTFLSALSGRVGRLA